MTGAVAGFAAAAGDGEAAAGLAAVAGLGPAAVAGLEPAAGLGASVGLAAAVTGTGGVDGAAQAAASSAPVVPRTVVNIDRRVSIADRGRMTLPPLNRRWPSTWGQRPRRRIL